METGITLCGDDDITGSYRTYEEWKRISTFIRFLYLLKFLPYLWGMETKNYEAYPEPA